MIEQMAHLRFFKIKTQHYMEALLTDTLNNSGPNGSYKTDTSTATRTIEGRIYGDPPWKTPKNFSYKWMDEPTMDKTINDYIQTNWDDICWELAKNWSFNRTFDAGKLVGEGFFNESQVASSPRSAKYGQTSYVTLRLKLDQSEPPRLILVAAFPAGKGYGKNHLMREKIYLAEIKSTITSEMDNVIHFLRVFSDADSMEEIKKEIDWLSQYSLKSLVEDLESLESLLDKLPKEEGDLAEIVAWEANWVLDDPTDEGAKKWLRDLAEIIRDALGDKAPPRVE
jgi:hypothetical protein